MEPETSQICEGKGQLVLKLCNGAGNPIILCKIHLHSEAIVIVVAYSGIMWRKLSFTVKVGLSEREGGALRKSRGGSRTGTILHVTPSTPHI
jgi:hypothetical protein